jgi:acetylornithine deacetylase/succinyl-diaminopimelate desuccinylase-like protein
MKESRPQSFSIIVLIALVILSGSPSGLETSTCAQAVKSTDWNTAQKEALDLFLRYLRVDTTNPPGNETRAARFFAAICEREGIEYRVVGSTEDRATLWARVRGDGSRRPLVLLNHTDVVPHTREYWSVDPFGAIEKDGFIYGRGAIDMKSLAIVQFEALLTLKRSGARLKRDVIFLATADEEAGGRVGAGWFVKTHAEMLGNAEFLLTEGANNIVQSGGRVEAIGLCTAEKTPAWLKLTATGEAGHASVPDPNSSVNRLLRALNRLLDYTPPIQVTESVDQAFKSMAPLMQPGVRSKYANLREGLKDPSFAREFQMNPNSRALIRNTISITMLEGSNKTNIIPPVAHAEIDTRLVPGEKLDRWVAELKGVINDERIRIEPTLAFEARSSPASSDLRRALEKVVKRRYPGAIITLPVLAGFTDSHYFRDIGIASYGFWPFVAAPEALGGGFHGNNERIGRQPFMDGVRFMFEVVAEIAE